MLDPQTVIGSSAKFPGGLVAARAVAQALVDSNPSPGLAGLKAYSPFSTGRVSDMVLDSDVRSSAEYIGGNDGNSASLSHKPGWESDDAHCVVEFQGGVFINCWVIQGWSAVDVEELIDARLAARTNADAE